LGQNNGTYKDRSVSTASGGLNLSSNQVVNLQTLTVLYGHDSDLTCVAVNRDLDMVVTASTDGTCIIHTLRKGKYVMSLESEVRRVGGAGGGSHGSNAGSSGGGSAGGSGSSTKRGSTSRSSRMKGRAGGVLEGFAHLAVSRNGHVVGFSSDDWAAGFTSLYVHDVNGRRQAAVTTISRLNVLRVTEDSRCVITAADRRVTLRQMSDLSEMKVYDVFKDLTDFYNPAPSGGGVGGKRMSGISVNKEVCVRSLSVSDTGYHMLVALEDGRLLIYALLWDLFIKEKQLVLDLFLM
jgi:WD40 repeat protein